MDVRGANTFPLHNQLPNLYLLNFEDRLIRFLSWVLSIFSRSFLEQIKLGGDFTVFENKKIFENRVASVGDSTGDH